MMADNFQLAHHSGSDYCEWGSSSRRPLVQFDMAHKGEWLASVIGKHPLTDEDMVYYVVRCEFCICTHLFPLSKPEDLEEYYRRKFYQETKSNYLEEYQEDKEWWLATHRTVIDVANRYLNKPVVSMLDVGAGPGWPLVIGKDQRYKTYALEPSPVCAAHLREFGHIVYETTMEKLHSIPDSADSFDLLYMWEVLEHQPNPEDFLLKCHDLLHSGGVLVVAVPSDFTPAQFQAMERFNLNPWFVSAPDHQHYFTPKTLQLMLRRCGFSIRYTRMTFPLIEEIMLGLGHQYVGNSQLGRECHRARVKFELDTINLGRWPELEEIYMRNVSKRIGREIIMVAVKD